MSFVAGQAEITDLNDKISDITQKITSLKFEVIHMMEESYVKFNILHQETVHLESKVKALSNDMNELLRRVETQVCLYVWLLNDPGSGAEVVYHEWYVVRNMRRKGCNIVLMFTFSIPYIISN